MNIRRGIIALGALSLVSGAGAAQAYDTYVMHPKQSRAMATAYAKGHEALSSDQIEWLAQGSLEEDEPGIRALNHFYDPQTKRPLTVAGIALGLASPAWLMSSFRQSLIPGRGDCSWKRALYEYQQGNESLAYICLGHALHLLEDVSVPAHTRNDDHLEGDSYESWLKYNNPEIPAAAALEPDCNTATDCIHALALWTNERFVSEDTIAGKPYPKPFEQAVVADNYLMDGKRKLAVYNPKSRNFRLTGEIQLAYWQEISPVLLAYGRRMLEIFYQEARVDEISEPLTLPGEVGNILERITTNIQNIVPNLKNVLVKDTKPSSEVSDDSKTLVTHSPEIIDPSGTAAEAGIAAGVPESHIDMLSTDAITAMAVIADHAPVQASKKSASNPAAKRERPIVPDTFMTTRPASVTKVTSAEFVFASDIPGAAFECSRSGDLWEQCPSAYRLEGLNDGAQRLSVRAFVGTERDATPLTYTWTVDMNPPLTFLFPEINNATREATFRFMSELDSHFECSFDSAEWTECASPQAYGSLETGDHIFSVRALDKVGNVEVNPATYSWTIESHIPAIPVVFFPTFSPYYTNQAEVTVSGTTEMGTTLLINNSNETVIQTAEQWESNRTLHNGVNSLSIRARTIYNEISDPYELVIIRDTIAPTAFIKNLDSSQLTTDFTVQWEGRDNQPGVLMYEVETKLYGEDWQPWQSATEQSEAVFSSTGYPGLPIAFRVRALDQAGNRGEWSEAVETMIAAPEINHLLISQLQASGSLPGNEFVELYNPTSQPLSLSGYQVQSFRSDAWINPLPLTSLDEIIVAPHGYYLIAGPKYVYPILADRKLSNEFITNENGAIRIIDANGMVIDQLGYGEGVGEGAAAPRLEPGIALERKHLALSTAASLRPGPVSNEYDINENSFDFVIQTDPQPRASHNKASDKIALGDELKALWHFDECEGSVTQQSVGNNTAAVFPLSAWTVGVFGCAMEQGPRDMALSWNLPAAVGPELTLSFFASSLYSWSSGELWLVNDEGNNSAGVMPRPDDARVLHKGQVMSFLGVPSDGLWHQISVVYSSTYLAWYVDGELKYKLLGDYRQDHNITALSIRQIAVPWQLDEIAIWSRALSIEEIQASALTQLSPRLEREPQAPAALIHHWDFDESARAADLIGDADIINSSRLPGRQGLALYGNWRDNSVTAVDVPDILSKDMSLSYWRLGTGLYTGDVKLVDRNTNSSFGASAARGYESVYWHNGGRFGLGLELPGDNAWHHIAVVYDSYAYEIRYYIDGIERARRPHIWQTVPLNRLLIVEEQGASVTDDLKIFKGALTAEEVRTLADE